jgi:hypothetical protein
VSELTGTFIQNRHREIYSHQNALKRFAAGLRPNPLGELKRFFRPIAAVPKAVEWIFPSRSLAAVRDALQQWGEG